MYKKLYGEEYGKTMVAKIKSTLVELLDEYSSKSLESCETPIELGENMLANRFRSEVVLNSESDDEDLYQFMSKKRRTETKSELDLYLEEKPLNMKEDLNILQYWKQNANRFVTISALARDLLSVPISTVPSESAFSLSKKTISPCRSSLSPTTVDALSCYEDWLRAQGFEPSRL